MQWQGRHAMSSPSQLCSRNLDLKTGFLIDLSFLITIYFASAALGIFENGAVKLFGSYPLLFNHRTQQICLKIYDVKRQCIANSLILTKLNDCDFYICQIHCNQLQYDMQQIQVLIQFCATQLFLVDLAHTRTNPHYILLQYSLHTQANTLHHTPHYWANYIHYTRKQLFYDILK